MDDEGDEESVIEAMGNLQSFLQTLGKTPSFSGSSSRKQNVVGGVMWVPDSQQCHWKRYRGWEHGSDVDGSQKSEMGWHMAGGDKLWG